MEAADVGEIEGARTGEPSGGARARVDARREEERAAVRRGGGGRVRWEVREPIC